MWYQDPKWRDRLLVEKVLMEERFPGFILTQVSPGAPLVWHGALQPVPQGPVFEISITVPARYPYELPALRVERPSLSAGAPHVYLTGYLCVHRKSWDPTRGTVASIVPLAAAWLTAYEHWRETGETF